MSERFVAASNAADLAVKYGPTATKYGAAVVAAGMAYAGASVAGLTLENHRHLSHHSAKPSKGLSKLIRADQRSIGMEPTIWAGVHREPHHGHPDGTTFPHFQIAQVVHWLTDNPEAEVAQGIVLPEVFEGLDPRVDKFTLDEVMEIGDQSIDEVKARLKDEYVLPEYTRENIENILYSTEPRCYYKDIKVDKKRHTGPYTPDEEAWFILTDAHAPILEPPVDGHHNGVRSLGKNMVKRYKKQSDWFKDKPSRKPDDLKLPREVGLKGDEQPDRVEKHWPYVVGSIVGLSALAFAARRKITPKDAAVALAVGGAVKGVATYFQVKAGKWINRWGHMGKLDSFNDFVQATYGRDYHIKLNEDGGAATDVSDMGIVGDIIKILTLDEADQLDHHLYPDKPDFNQFHDAGEEFVPPPHTEFRKSKGRGSFIRRFAATPWGTTIKTIEESRIPQIEPGEGFDASNGKLRPDEPTHAMRRLMNIRVEQMEGRRSEHLLLSKV